MTLIELCGKFHGSRAQAILRQLFDDQKLLAAIGAANQCRGIRTGENGDTIPADLLKMFKDGTAATLRRDKFTYQQAISREQANIERVTKRQGQFVALLGSIVLSIFVGVSNFVSMVAFEYWAASGADDAMGSTGS
jgi:hypothetical protein